MQELFQFLREFDLHTIITMAACWWFFSRDIKKEIKEIHKDNKFYNVRLSRTEGTVYGKDLYRTAPNEEKSVD